MHPLFSACSAATPENSCANIDPKLSVPLTINSEVTLASVFSVSCNSSVCSSVSVSLISTVSSVSVISASFSVSVCTISAACISSSSVSVPSDPVFSVRISSDSSVSSLSVTLLLSVPDSSSCTTAVSSCAANTLSGNEIPVMVTVTASRPASNLLYITHSSLQFSFVITFSFKLIGTLSLLYKSFCSLSIDILKLQGFRF